MRYLSSISKPALSTLPHRFLEEARFELLPRHIVCDQNATCPNGASKQCLGYRWMGDTNVAQNVASLLTNFGHWKRHLLGGIMDLVTEFTKQQDQVAKKSTVSPASTPLFSTTMTISSPTKVSQSGATVKRG